MLMQAWDYQMLTVADPMTRLLTFAEQVRTHRPGDRFESLQHVRSCKALYGRQNGFLACLLVLTVASRGKFGA